MNKYLIVLFVILSGCSNDYDKVCDYFGELASHPGINALSVAEKDAFIRSKLENLGEESEARVLWENMRYLWPPSERYEMFKIGVSEMQGIEDWHCEPMKQLAASAFDPDYAPTKEVKAEDMPDIVLESEADWNE